MGGSSSSVTDDQARGIIAAIGADDAKKLELLLGSPGCRFRLSFLLGTHPRIGSLSPIRNLDRISIALIFAKLVGCNWIPLNHAHPALSLCLTAGEWQKQYRSYEVLCCGRCVQWWL